MMPIKRNENIVLLSKDHHFALLFCWKIRNGLKQKASLQRIHDYILYFWNSHLHTHFKEEENILFKGINDPLVVQAQQQHAEISALIDLIHTGKNVSEEQYNHLADMVDAHIRFEERDLFPRLESILSAEALSSIGRQLTSVHKEIKDEFADEFWLKK
ncbi:MAG: hemerythrin domain-containing protein [Bacteroidetes bacterium]|nr:hemerythrin domain-containing protein [Bacteroidota bacterium]MBS1756478.1 hemerythrin domain-containing protein [Bacteroidota bacterium]